MSNENRPGLHLIGNAHLDPIWLWRWQEGCGEVLQTFRAALDRLNEYPGFVFTCSSASYYKWVEEIEPDTFEEIRARIKEGRWVPVNGWWVQPDCNLPSGESFARHALYSQLYYYEKFGITCRTGYNVDSFGHNAMLPQLLQQGGMNAYVMMRPGMHENDQIPENLFWWDAPDGSRVLTYRIPFGYAANGAQTLERELKAYGGRMESSGHGMMLFYGVGNHGGGPTRSDIDLLLGKMEDEGFANLKFSSPDGFFEEAFTTYLDIPVWKDDLQHHASGCYSATGMVKDLNRRAENALFAAESWSTIANQTLGARDRTAEFADAWHEVLFNQFHDILDGCSIMEAYEDVRQSMGYALHIAAKAENNAHLSISRKIDTWVPGIDAPYNDENPSGAQLRHRSAPAGFPRPVVVFNPLSFAVEVPVRTYQPSELVKNDAGEAVPFQNIRSSRSNDSHLDTLFLAKLPALGYATYWLWGRSDENGAVKTAVRTHSLEIENEFVRVEFERFTGFIKFIGRKHRGENFLGGSGAVPFVIDDKKSDTWAHNIFRFHDIKARMELCSIELIETGPVRALIRTKHSYNGSWLVQNFSLSAGQKSVHVECKVLWQEPHTLLKLAFPVSGLDEISTYEIPNGYIKRPCNGEEEPAQRWADVTTQGASGRRGISILNSGRCSYDCQGAQIRLTALRNAIFADHYSHRPAADFNYTDEGLARFEYGIFLHEGEAEESEVVREAAIFNNRPVAVPEGYHKGELPRTKSYIEIGAENIAATALKLCEDGSGAVVLRCYETAGKQTRTTVRLPLADAFFHTDFRPHEIKTYRIEKDGRVSVTNFLEGIVRNIRKRD